MVVSVIVVAALFLGMGTVALVSPAFVVGLFGMTPETPDSRNEVRAVYGGFGLVVAGVLIASLYSPELERGILLTVGVSLAGMAGGRLLSFALERTTKVPVCICLAEVVGSTMLLIHV